jgi:hypothetical protein
MLNQGRKAMAYMADDFAYIAERLKEIRAAKLPDANALRAREEFPRLQRDATVADRARYMPTTSQGLVLRS